MAAGSHVISTLAEMQMSSHCDNELRLDAKGYENRPRLIDFTVVTSTAFCPKKNKTDNVSLIIEKAASG